jgi:hypothetical protein
MGVLGLIMVRFLGLECPNCVTLFAVAQLEGSVSSKQSDPMVLEDVDCPHCGQHFSQLTAEVVEFEAEEAPTSGKPDAPAKE